MLLAKLNFWEKAFICEPLVFAHVVLQFGVATLIAMELVPQHPWWLSVNQSALLNGLNNCTLVAFDDFEVFLALVQQMVAQSNRTIQSFWPCIFAYLSRQIILVCTVRASISQAPDHVEDMSLHMNHLVGLVSQRTRMLLLGAARTHNKTRCFDSNTLHTRIQRHVFVHRSFSATEFSHLVFQLTIENQHLTFHTGSNTSKIILASFFVFVFVLGPHLCPVWVFEESLIEQSG